MRRECTNCGGVALSKSGADAKVICAKCKINIKRLSRLKIKRSGSFKSKKLLRIFGTLAKPDEHRAAFFCGEYADVII